MTGTNDAPVAQAGTNSATEDGAVVNGTLTETDVDTNDTHTYTLVSGTSEGTAVVNSNGSYTFDPGSDFQDLASGETRDVTFVYEVEDNNGATSQETVTITVSGRNDGPVITDNHGATVLEGGQVSIDSAMLSTSDADDGSTELHYTVSGSPAHGHLELSTAPGIAVSAFTQNDLDAGRVVYVHDGSETTSDSFAFTVSDGGEDSAPADSGVFSLSVTPVNDDPTNEGSLPTNISVVEDVASDVDLGLLDLSDVDVPSGNMTLTVATTSGGTLAATSASGVVVAGSGSSSITLTGSLADLNSFLDNASNIQFTSSANANGVAADGLTIELTDNGNFGIGGGGNVSLGSVAVDIVAINDDPTNTGSVPTDVSVTEDVVSPIDLSSLDISDVDASSGSMTITLTSSLSGHFSAVETGGVTVTGGGTNQLQLTGDIAALNAYLDTGNNILFVDGLNVNGDNANHINIYVSDLGNVGQGGGGMIFLGTTNVDIIAVNDAPVGQSESFSVLTGNSIVETSGLLTNDSDVDMDALAAVLHTGPAHGTLNLMADGTFVFTPDPGFFGLDAFTYRVSDGTLLSAPITVSLEVVAGSSPPPEPPTPPEPEDPADETEENNNDNEEEQEDSDENDTVAKSNPNAPGVVVERGIPRLIDKAEHHDAEHKIAELERSQRQPINLSQEYQNETSFQFGGATVLNQVAQFDLELQLFDRLLELDMQQAIVWTQWDDWTPEIKDTAFGRYYVGIAGATAGIASIGYVLWALRGGLLLTTMLGSMPAWQLLDPAAMLLEYRGNGKKKGEGLGVFLEE